MKSELKLFGPAHLLILISIPLLAVGLALWCRRNGSAARFIRYGLAGSLALIELIWYVYVLRVQGFHFPNGLALDLCDVTLWVTVLAASTLKPWVCEIVYYTGLAGSGMALFTPDLWTPGWSYPIISFFLAHGITVVTVLTLVWGKLARPRAGSVWRVLAIVNAYAVRRDLQDQLHVFVPETGRGFASGLLWSVARLSGGWRTDRAGFVLVAVASVPIFCGAPRWRRLKRYPHNAVGPFFSFAGIPDENKFFNRGRDGSCFAQQNYSGTPSARREASEMRRHCPPILADKNSPGVRCDPQHFWISQTRKAGIARSAHVDLACCPSQPS